ncbi:zinc finger HIT domain-containing protein 3 [Selaginella moellendorffii]|nr:zinc finger HIT domain-containing protein 3 [Selaginella moellendorffii]|eukprot:XP_002971725.2 zinc finger HIT domain-containing protein 3 [Selaginella moellendorffii]
MVMFLIGSRAMSQCGICSGAVSKYKCPGCLVPYCSLQCFKDHKAAPCTKVAAAEEEEQAQLVQPPRDFENGDESQMATRLRRQQLEAVAASEEIRAMLRNEELQAIVSKIDASATAEKDLDTAMNLPDFKGFADKILEVIASSR